MSKINNLILESPEKKADIHSNAILETPNLIVLWMVSLIPDSYFISNKTTFFDPACGRGTFLKYIYVKLRQHGHGHQNAISRIFGVDKYSPANETSDIFPNIIKKDFLKMDFPANWPKEFDVIISNPPFGSRTDKKDLKFIERCSTINSEIMIFIHPASSYLDLKGNNKTYKNYLQNHLSTIEEITLLNGNFIFDINTPSPCCSITKFNKRKKEGTIVVKNKIFNREDEINSFDELTLWGARKEFFSFKKKMAEEVRSIGSLHSEGNVLGSRAIPQINNPESYFVEFTPIRGNISNESNNIHKDDFFTIIRSDLRVKRHTPVRFLIWFEFLTESEANNFIGYLKTDFARMCLALSKTNTTLFNGELKSIPWMDFTQEWTDEKLYSKFNITEEEQSFIKEIIKPYYESRGEEPSN